MTISYGPLSHTSGLRCPKTALSPIDSQRQRTHMPRRSVASGNRRRDRQVPGLWETPDHSNEKNVVPKVYYFCAFYMFHKINAFRSGTTNKKTTSTLLLIAPQSRFGDELLGIPVVRPPKQDNSSKRGCYSNIQLIQPVGAAFVCVRFCHGIARVIRVGAIKSARIMRHDTAGGEGRGGYTV